MSRNNIIDMDIRDFSVTFQLRRGGQRTYYYNMADFAEILDGADPANYTASGGSTSVGEATAGDAAIAAIEGAAESL